MYQYLHLRLDDWYHLPSDHHHPLLVHHGPHPLIQRGETQLVLHHRHHLWQGGRIGGPGDSPREGMLSISYDYQGLAEITYCNPCHKYWTLTIIYFSLRYISYNHLSVFLSLIMIWDNHLSFFTSLILICDIHISFSWRYNFVTITYLFTFL